MEQVWASICVLRNQSIVDRGRVGREGAALPWCQTWQEGMGNSLPTWTPSLVQGMLPTMELVSNPWEHGKTFKEKQVNSTELHLALGLSTLHGAE